MLLEGGAELVREQCLLPSGFPGEVREEQEEGQQRAVPADGESRAGKHQENPGIDGVANVRVGAGADQFDVQLSRQQFRSNSGRCERGPKWQRPRRQASGSRPARGHRAGEWNKAPAEKAAVPEIGVQEQQRRNDYGPSREARSGRLPVLDSIDRQTGEDPIEQEDQPSRTDQISGIEHFYSPARVITINQIGACCFAGKCVNLPRS